MSGSEPAGARYGTTVADGTVYVGAPGGRVEVGAVGELLAAVGGPAWTVTYSDWEKERYPGMDTSDEGLTVDVVDTVNAMTVEEGFAEALAAQPAEPTAEGGLSPRMGLFVGRLLENLEHGVE